jgi:hypothetical protein
MNEHTIRIKQTDDGPWEPVQLLTIAFGWVEVEVDNELLWVAASQIHPADRKRLAAGIAWSSSPSYRGTKLNRAQVEQILIDARQKNADPDLRGVDLSLADLHDLDLSRVDFRGVNLSETILAGANLTGARLKGANLSEADLRGARLEAADLRFANLSGAEYNGSTIWAAEFDPVQAGAIQV